MKRNYDLWLKDNNHFQFITTTKKLFSLHEKISYCKQPLKRWQMELLLIDCNAYDDHRMIRKGNIIALTTPHGKAWYKSL